MAWSLTRPSEIELRRWIESSIAAGTHRLGAGYQSNTYLYDTGEARLVVKAPGGRWPYRWFSGWLIRREAHAYRRLEGLKNIPTYRGLIDNRYLVVDYVPGEPARYAEIADRDQFFSELLRSIQAMHARGVAHGDLQKKDNLWVSNGHPVLIDFGASVIRRGGSALVNRWLFRFAAQLDLNQWAKLKTRGRPDRLPEAERALYRRTFPERLASALKYPFRRIRHKQRP